jgi:hypothetical protein
MNRYNEQLAMAHQVKDLLRRPGLRDRFEQECKRFRDWQAEWKENAGQTQISGETEAHEEISDDLIIEHLSQEEFDRWKRQQQEHEHRPTGRSPLDSLLAVSPHSETELLTEMSAFFIPPEAEPVLDPAHALCLQYVRLAILHDMALRTEGTRQPLTEGILDPQTVQAAWEYMTHRDKGGDAWDSWRSGFDEALKDVAAEQSKAAPAAGEAPPLAMKRKRRSKAAWMVAIMGYMRNHPNATAGEVAKAIGGTPEIVRKYWGGVKKTLAELKREKPRGWRTDDGGIEAVDKSATCKTCQEPLIESFRCGLCEETIKGECKTCHFTNTHPDQATP